LSECVTNLAHRPSLVVLGDDTVGGRQSSSRGGRFRRRLFGYPQLPPSDEDRDGDRNVPQDEESAPKAHVQAYSSMPFKDRGNSFRKGGPTGESAGVCGFTVALFAKNGVTYHVIRYWWRLCDSRHAIWRFLDINSIMPNTQIMPGSVAGTRQWDWTR
jgi:hypothetical protein